MPRGRRMIQLFQRRTERVQFGAEAAPVSRLQFRERRARRTHASPRQSAPAAPCTAPRAPGRAVLPSPPCRHRPRSRASVPAIGPPGQPREITLAANLPGWFLARGTPASSLQSSSGAGSFGAPLALEPLLLLESVDRGLCAPCPVPVRSPIDTCARTGPACGASVPNPERFQSRNRKRRQRRLAKGPSFPVRP